MLDAQHVGPTEISDLKKSNENRTSTSLLWGSNCLFLLQREADTSGCRVGSSMVCIGPDHAVPATAEGGRPGIWGCRGCPAPASGLPGPLLTPACTCCCPGLCSRALCSREWMLRSVSQTGSLTHVARKSSDPLCAVHSTPTSGAFHLDSACPKGSCSAQEPHSIVYPFPKLLQQNICVLLNTQVSTHKLCGGFTHQPHP